MAIPLVGVDGDTEEAGVGVNQLELVPDHRVPEDTGITKEGEVSHVLRAVELARVDLAHLLRFELLYLAANIDLELLASIEGVILDILLADSLKVATVSLVRNPA